MIRLLRGAGRWALAWMFVRASVDVLRDPARPAVTAGPFLASLRGRVPVTLPDDATVVRANAGAQLAAGALFAANRAPRLAAAALIGSLVPTTVAGHAFWKVEDRSLRPNQRNHFNKNVAAVGGLLLFLTGPSGRRDRRRSRRDRRDRSENPNR